MGDTVQLLTGDTVQVLDYEANATPSNSFSKPQPGMAFAAIDVRACAGANGSAIGVVNPFFFTLLMPDSSRLQTSIPVKEPGLGVGPRSPGECIRGFVTYEVPVGTKPAAVVFETSGLQVAWAIT